MSHPTDQYGIIGGMWTPMFSSQRSMANNNMLMMTLYVDLKSEGFRSAVTVFSVSTCMHPIMYYAVLAILCFGLQTPQDQCCSNKHITPGFI